MSWRLAGRRSWPPAACPAIWRGLQDRGIWRAWLGLFFALTACAVPAASAPGATPTLATHVPAASSQRAHTQAANAVAATQALARTATPIAATSPPSQPGSALTSSPEPGVTPSATGCVPPTCDPSQARLWLERPIQPDADFVNYVDRSYPYGSTQEGLREPHHGVEFFNSRGTPVLAAAPGRVVVAGEDTATRYGPDKDFYGRLVVIEHDRSFLEQPVFSLYGHLESVQVAAGQRVETGDMLGTVGATGVAIGAHLHFEVRIGRNSYDATRNPELWLKPLPYDGRPQSVIAGRVEDATGRLLPEITVVIRPLDTVSDQPRNRYVLTYAESEYGLNGDEELNENFAIGDVPPGTYVVSVSTTRFYQQTITVRPGQIGWVQFVVNPPLPQPPTATPSPTAEGEAVDPPGDDGAPDDEPAPTDTPSP
jgi:murein DD-endopeptidase MepM/ murein hydrolase activator NlpD